MTTALVVGAGVGGLTAAVALRRAGLDVELYERAASPQSIQVGGGLHVWPNGMRGLQRVGLADRVEAAGRRISRLDWCSPGHGVLASADLAATARAVGAPSVGIRRADLLGVLLQEVDPSTIRFAAEVSGFEQDDGAAIARFAEGGQAQADVLVAADGLRSTMRPLLTGAHDLREPGVLVCQATVRDVEPVAPGVFVEVWAPELRFGCYGVRDGAYWFAFVRHREPEDLPPRERVLELAHDWEPELRAVLESTPPEAVVCANVVARAPLESWTEGRVALLGDAAHAMTPFTGQGACQAIEDAVVLADCLAETDEPTMGLRAYEERRLGRANAIWARAWAAASSFATKSRSIDPTRSAAFAGAFERVVWKQLERTIVEPF
jgi:2-polyprenyl-6-methoxyphenol hydroxylase-like FAD-dependent oxidoreductase